LGDLSAPKRLQIVAAGAWHNSVLWLLLYLFTYAKMDVVWSTLGYENVEDRGVAVLGVEDVRAFIVKFLVS
jgi:hypothetical protein